MVIHLVVVHSCWVLCRFFNCPQPLQKRRLHEINKIISARSGNNAGNKQTSVGLLLSFLAGWVCAGHCENLTYANGIADFWTVGLYDEKCCCTDTSTKRYSSWSSCSSCPGGFSAVQYGAVNLGRRSSMRAIGRVEDPILL